MMAPKKPEWFQLTEGEGRRVPGRRKRIIKVAALTAPLVIVAAGVVVAQTGESGSADAVTSTPTALATVDPTPIAETVPAAPTTPKVASSKSNFVKKPSIANPPTRRGGDDDEFGEHEGREHRGGHDDDHDEWGDDD